MNKTFEIKQLYKNILLSTLTSVKRKLTRDCFIRGISSLLDKKGQRKKMINFH